MTKKSTRWWPSEEFCKHTCFQLDVCLFLDVYISVKLELRNQRMKCEFMLFNIIINKNIYASGSPLIAF